MSFSPTNAAVASCLAQAKEDWISGTRMNPFSTAAEWLNPRDRQAEYHDTLRRAAFTCFASACGAYITGEPTAALGFPIRDWAGAVLEEAWPESDTLAAFDAAIELAWGPHEAA